MPPFSDQIRGHDLSAVIHYLRHDYIPTTTATAGVASSTPTPTKAH
jgi:hypothetical protein